MIVRFLTRKHLLRQAHPPRPSPPAAAPTAHQGGQCQGREKNRMRIGRHSNHPGRPNKQIKLGKQCKGDCPSQILMRSLSWQAAWADDSATSGGTHRQKQRPRNLTWSPTLTPLVPSQGSASLRRGSFRGRYSMSVSVSSSASRAGRVGAMSRVELWKNLQSENRHMGMTRLAHQAASCQPRGTFCDGTHCRCATAASVPPHSRP